MSQELNPREVLSYLNELGYVNITAQQLKEFIKDLKKLIKYESRCEGSPLFARNFSSDFQNNQDTAEYNKKTPEYDIFHALHDHNTIASKARTESRKGKQISVHIGQARSSKKLHDHCVHVNTIENEFVSEPVYKESVDSEPVLNKNEDTNTDLPKNEVKTEVSSMQITNPTSKETISSAPIKPKKSGKSVIRVGSAKSINRCDPVALYHQYKEEWKKIKFPGQDHHSDLRWAVREKLLSVPPVQVPLRRTSSKRKM
nr:hydrolethalus syndrome protein 1 homolog [Leptinotarsa decemlineata]